MAETDLLTTNRDRRIFCWEATEEESCPSCRPTISTSWLPRADDFANAGLLGRYRDGLAWRIHEISEQQFALNQGTLYPALLKLEQLGWITSSWGSSDNNRRARYYAISRAGQKQLKAEAEKWAKTSRIVARFIDPTENLG